MSEQNAYLELHAYGPHTRVIGAQIIEAVGDDLRILVDVREPEARAPGWDRESAWQEDVLRFARRTTHAMGTTCYVQFDPGRDQAETVLL